MRLCQGNIDFMVSFSLCATQSLELHERIYSTKASRACTAQPPNVDRLLSLLALRFLFLLLLVHFLLLLFVVVDIRLLSTLGLRGALHRQPPGAAPTNAGTGVSSASARMFLSPSAVSELPDAVQRLVSSLT
ncbi:putative transmembrane protein [Toxoplasma gondii RUB]|uniref:Putative transmembrane protein n=1 Tax=Toxoplasma gondii RUB TaxID=935652 RepID=A0A086LTR0_TOXGO|nr:putative transmembrane protein [Toxoplasma gondii RUB]